MISSNKKNESPKAYARKQVLWSVLFVVIAALSIFVVMQQSREFSIARLIDFFKNSSPLWLVISFCSMLCFIVFEAMALLLLCRAFGYKQRLSHGILYSTGDIYFSAITPSATGGQPVSAYFMVKNGIPPMVVTVILLANLLMYILAIIAIGLICFIFFPGTFAHFSPFSKLLIIIGSIVQVALASFFLLLLRHEKLLHRISSFFLHLLCKLRILKNEEAKKEKLANYMASYREYSVLLSGHSKTLAFTFVFNFLQRIAQIAITMFTYLASGGAGSKALDLMALQGYVVLGSNSIPIPGAMGVCDYLMLDGFGAIMSESAAVNLELVSRSFSFYICIIICGLVTLWGYRTFKKRDKKKK